MFSKPTAPSIELVEGHGVLGDAHFGVRVQHRSRVARDPSQPNLRQVHLVARELLLELVKAGFDIAAGRLGENITTEGIDLINLPRDTRLHLGERAIIRVTGLRNPCSQIENFQKGMLAAVLARDAAGALVRRAGVMAVVEAGGTVCAGDAIRIERPSGAWLALEPV